MGAIWNFNNFPRKKEPEQSRATKDWQNYYNPINFRVFLYNFKVIYCFQSVTYSFFLRFISSLIADAFS